MEKKTLKIDYPREVPIINKAVEIANSMGARQAGLKCQVDALIKYQKACAKAMAKLTEDLEKCSTL